MLQFIFGRAGFGKTFKIQEIIKEKLAKNVDKLMLIVPEQSSFDTEKSILNLFGAQAATRVQVVTFTRLLDLVAREIGGVSGKKLNKSDRNLLMSLAIDEVRDELNVYAGQTDRIEFVEMMVSALSEFKMCNVTQNSILEISQEVKEPLLRGKLQETARIFERYEALLQGTYLDPLDDLTRLAQNLSYHDFFRGYTVFIDGFEGFTMQQISILEIILKQSEAVYITLCTDKTVFSDDKFSLFAPINRTAQRILAIAQKNKVEVRQSLYLENSQRFKSAGVKMLEAQLFRAKKEKKSTKIDDVFIFNGNTKYDEADFICRTIKRLVFEKGYKYKDFAVITRNDEIYRGVLDVAFEKYEIPYFMDRREEISSKPLMLLVLSALEVINKNFSSSSIFQYLKTGLTGLSVDEISELENYVLFWNITGKRWLSEFTANPDGYEKTNEKSEEKLFKFNELRCKIISPIVNLKQNISKTNGDAVAKKIYDFLTEINITENLKAFCQDLNEWNQQILAVEQARLWDLLVEILERMVAILKERKIAVSKYSKLLKLAINSYDMAFIPRGVDEVTFGSIDRVRAQDIKIVFLLGAVEGEFPRTPVASGIFSDAQRKQLILMGLPLYDEVERLAVNERFLAYKAATMPSERLYVTWSSATMQGGAKSASAIVREIKFILPNVECADAHSLRLDDEIWVTKPAFELCAKHWQDDSRFSQTLKHFFEQNDAYKEKVFAIENATSGMPFMMQNSQKTTSEFGENVRVSASQIEKFYLCKFAYFCKYGMLAKDRKKAKFDALQYGSLMHFIFEKILKKFDAKQLMDFSKKELYAAVRGILNIYIEENLGGWTDKTKRFRYLFNRVANSAVPLVLHMAKELTQSDFLPTEFELELSQRKNGAQPLELALFDGSKIIVEGKIDRVDVMQKNGQKYVRVVDYKTGAKEFQLSDVLYGLNLQMLVYLQAICSNLEKSSEKVIPAGMLYLPSVSTALNLDRDENLAKLEQEKMKKLRMNGLILDDSEVIFGMERDGEGIFIPVSMKDGRPKNCESLANMAQMGAIMRRVNELIISMAEQLKHGKIDASPAKGNYDACEFCEFKAVCAPMRNENLRKIESFKSDEVWRKLEQKAGGANG